MQVAERLPVVDVSIGQPKLRKQQPDTDADVDVEGKAANDEASSKQYTLHVDLKRQLGAASSGRGGVAAAGSRARVYAPWYVPVHRFNLSLHISVRSPRTFFVLVKSKKCFEAELPINTLYCFENLSTAPVILFTCWPVKFFSTTKNV